jgi:hypothetical protein
MTQIRLLILMGLIWLILRIVKAMPAGYPGCADIATGALRALDQIRKDSAGAA